MGKLINGVYDSIDKHYARVNATYPAVIHRARLHEKDNTREGIKYWVGEGDAVEVDVWLDGGELFLGHDGPETLITEKDYAWLEDNITKVIFHCKTLSTLLYMTGGETNWHCFMHDKDEAAFTSWGFVWAFPVIYKNGKYVGKVI